jgi:hypothetical protein
MVQTYYSTKEYQANNIEDADTPADQWAHHTGFRTSIPKVSFSVT